MAPRATKAEHVIEHLAGCGPFQVVIIIVILFMCKSMVAYTVVFMVFGSYNPGWRCMDNETEFSPTNYTTETMTLSSRNVTMNDDDVYAVGTCDDYTKCNDAKFNPSTSTVVSEWGLICDDAWIVKLIISIQMLGMLIGAYLSGLLSDWVGRKKTLCLGMAVCCVFLLISSFSVAWLMFLVTRFVIGMCLASNLIVTFLYVSEYMTRKWRAVTIVIPVWYTGSTVLALVSWIYKDWRSIELFACLVTGLCLVPFIWIPESLRWLEVKNKSQGFIVVSEKILKCNKKPLSPLDNIELKDTETECVQIQQDKKYTIFDLFRKGYKLITVCNVLLNFTTSLIYYAVTFGSKSLYGDFYFNLFVSNMIPLVLCILSVLVMKVASRRLHSVTFYGSTVVCSAVSIGILFSDNDAAKDFGSTILISVSRGALDGAWMGLLSRVTELYPTVVRGTAVGVASLSARVGGILAPLLIPDDKSVLYIFIIIMTVATLVCCLVSLKLPETKGAVLKETFDDATEDE